VCERNWPPASGSHHSSAREVGATARVVGPAAGGGTTAQGGARSAAAESATPAGRLTPGGTSRPGSFLQVQADGNVVVYDSASKALWSRTGGLVR
jgi:hypothetical protein